MEQNQNSKDENIIHVSGMYKNWFLDYASYVILERAVPHINDGLKPVQRRILHSLKEMHDGRYHKVANVIGHTMKYHPHGDASIGDAMIQIGQKDLLLDMQGNWGNIYTGDSAAAPRYIEVRLTQFALDVLYNKKITNWSNSYDGRGKEPENLPVKFPLLLTHGVEGIAVGLSTKILPHNFNELIDASIKVLKGVKPKIYPDFYSGGSADFSNYNDGKRGGRIRVRAKITSLGRDKLIITELPYTTTTTTLINSIIKANEKGKIKIKKIEDNTAESVEILITLPSGVSLEKTIDALYSFTNCEISISPLSCVIENNTPVFLGVSEILKKSTEHTVNLLTKELEVKLFEFQEKWHFMSLEIIFIENRIYRKIEELKTWDEIISTIYNELIPFTNKLIRKITNDDIVKLTEIKIKKITRFDLDNANNELAKLSKNIEDINKDLSNITSYAIEYFKDLKRKFGAERNRKTEIKTFENIDAKKVVVANKKLYVNRVDGFIGTSMKKDEYVCECSDIDDIIIFKSDGFMKIVKIDSKVFVGKNIIHCAVFKKKDDRTIYNMIYKDGTTGYSMMKRFAVKSITRNKEYLLTKSAKDSKILYFTSNPNGEAETVSVVLRKNPKLRNNKIEIDFAKLAIKAKTSIGNIVTKYNVNKVELKSHGVSTLSARKIWFDDTIKRLNTDNIGTELGDFNANDKILIIKQSGNLEIKSSDLGNHFSDNLILIEKHNPNKPISVVYFNSDKKSFYVKRFLTESKFQEFSFIGNNKDNYLEVVSTDWRPRIEIIFVKEKGKERKTEIVNIDEFISIKGVKVLGNKLTSKKVKEINILDPLPFNNETLSNNIELEIKNNDKINNNSTDNLNENNMGNQITLEL